MGTTCMYAWELPLILVSREEFKIQGCCLVVVESDGMTVMAVMTVMTDSKDDGHSSSDDMTGHWIHVLTVVSSSISTYLGRYVVFNDTYVSARSQVPIP